jgi:lysozyme
MFGNMERKNKFINACMFVCGLVVGGGLMYLIKGNDKQISEETVIGCDSFYPQVYGLDLSFWQGNIDWDQLSLPCDEDGCVSGKIPAPRNQRPVQFAFVRVTKSDSLVDSLYHKNYNEAKRLGIPCGAYHFLTDTVSGKAQAEFFLSHVKLEPGDLPPVLDVEHKPKNQTDAEFKASVLQWLDIVEKHYQVKPIIYTYFKFKMRYLSDSIFNDYPYWIAHYYVDSLEYKGSWKFWQHTDAGRLPGIKGNVDFNIYNGSYYDLRQMTIGSQETIGEKAYSAD